MGTQLPTRPASCGAFAFPSRVRIWRSCLDSGDEEQELVASTGTTRCFRQGHSCSFPPWGEAKGIWGFQGVGLRKSQRYHKHFRHIEHLLFDCPGGSGMGRPMAMALLRADLFRVCAWFVPAGAAPHVAFPCM